MVVPLLKSCPFQILALILEGRKGRGNGRRRPSRTSAQYRKLDNHLEEAGGIDGNGADNAASVRNIIYWVMVQVTDTLVGGGRGQMVESAD